MFHLGSISTGTLRTEDLIEAFSDALDTLTPDCQLVKDCVEWLDEDEDERSDYDERGGWLIDELHNALNDAAPAYTYFGSIDGDGADFGFWPDIDGLERAIQDGDEDVIKVDDLADIPNQFNGHVMLVNDHGNVTLFESVVSVEYKEVWAVV